MEKSPSLNVINFSFNKTKTPVVEFKESRKYKCIVCSYACVRPSAMKMHLLVHSHEKPFSCKDCKARFTQVSSLKRHCLRVHTEQKVFQCGNCNYLGATKDNLVAHMTIHSEIKPFSCKDCEKAFATAGQLKKHQSVAHAKEKRLKCSLCDYTCTWPSTLQTHELVHSKKKTFKCAECGKWFSRSSHLVRHNLTKHSPDKKYKCPHCKYSSHIKKTLKVHLLLHISKNKHKCDKCNTAFLTLASLKKHNKMVHSKENRYKCSVKNVDCDFKRSPEKNKESNEVQYSIKSCKTSVDLDQFSDQVDKEELKCGICQCTFDSKARLKLHIRQHTGSTLFSCSICGSSFRVYKSLKQHISNLHQKT